MRPKKFSTCLYCSKIFRKRRCTSIYCSQSCQCKDLRNKGIIKNKKRCGIILKCILCDKDFYVPQYRAKLEKTKYCSRSCLAKVHLKNFEDRRFKKTGRKHHKYKTIMIDGKQIREHRYVMEKFLNRKLFKTEHIHHINGNSLDNRIENLCILSNSEHQKIELIERKKIISSS